MKNQIITLIFLLALTSQAWAGRYLIPRDADVITKITNAPNASRELSQRVELLIWNIYKGKVVGWEQDFEQLSATADIMILQEAFLNPRMKRVFRESIVYNYVMATAWEDTKYSNTKSGVVTAAKVSPNDIGWQRSFFKEPISNTPKMTLFTEYKIRGSKKTLLVGNIHGINFVTTNKLRHMLKLAAERISTHSGPVVFGGDFNTWNASKMNMMIKTLSAARMKPVSFFPDGRKRVLGKILDHIWTKNLKVLSSKVHSKILSSDHKAMTVLLDLTI